MKYWKKATVFLLSAGMLLTALAGCSSNDSSEETTASESIEATESAEATASAATQTVDYEAASTFMDTDEIVMTINGEDITWAEYYYMMQQAVQTLVSSNTGIDWTSTASGTADLNGGTDMTQAEYVKYYAENSLLNYNATELFCTENGFEVTEEDKTAAEETLLANYESEEAMQEALADYYLSLEMYVHYAAIATETNNLFAELYGENGENVSDEQAATYAEENSYYQCKHILISTLNDDNTEMSEEDSAAKQEQAQSIANELHAYEGDTEGLETLFKEKMDEYNEDPGMDSYPNGYLFTTGQMVSEFEDATAALGDYEISDPVKSSYGYHIIMRVPINYDDNAVSNSSSSTLRYLVASALCSDAIQEIQDGLEVTYSDAYSTIDPTVIFTYTEE